MGLTDRSAPGIGDAVRMVTRAVALITLATVGLPVPAGAVPSCLEQCNLSKNSKSDCCLVEPCLVTPCSNYLGCRGVAQQDLDTCINDSLDCRPISPGRCTIVRACVKRCESLYKQQVKQCERDAFGIVPGCSGGDCDLSSKRARKQAAQVCNACTSVSTTSTTTTTTSTSTVTTATGATTSTTTTTVTTTSVAPAPEQPVTEPCLQPCLTRMSSIRKCYGECAGRCNGSKRAENICQQACRNFLCSSIKARCTTPESGVSLDTDPQYLHCCTKKDSCITRDEAPCKVTTTTTSTSSTTTPSSSTSTTTTTTLG